MTKEEKIKEVYKHLYNINKIDKDGWYNNSNEKIKFHHSEFLGEMEYKNNFWFRPKSLQGIENNNGWIKIESEADLPKDKGYYDFQKLPDDVYKVNPVFWNPTSTKIGWFIETYTHYQPIEKPKPPIY